MNLVRTCTKFSSLLLVCAAPYALATTVNMTLTGPPPGPSMGGVYTSPYTATINGVSTYVICDDFLTDVSAGLSWVATETSVADLQNETTPSTAVKFDHTTTAAQQKQDYVAAAYLAEELMNVDQSTQAGQTIAGELSFAIWGVFDPPAISSTYLTPSELTAASNYKSQAYTATAGQSPINYANVEIFTPTPNQNTSQEYLVVTAPEAPLPLVLAVDLSGFALFVLLLGKRMLRRA